VVGSWRFCQDAKDCFGEIVWKRLLFKMKIILWTFIWIISENFLKGQNLVWVNGIGSIEWEAGYSMAIGDFGYVFIAGSFQETVQFGNDVSLTSNGWIDTFIAKYDTSGNCIWAINMGGEYDDYCYSIALDENGKIYGTGSFGRLADFNPTNEENILTPSGISDLYIASRELQDNFPEEGKRLDHFNCTHCAPWRCL